MTAGIAEYTQPSTFIGSATLALPAPSDNHAIASGDVFALNGMYNESSWDQCRNNTEIVIAANALRTTNFVSAAFKNYNGRGILFTLNISQASGTGGLIFKIFAMDKSGNSIQVNATPAAILALGSYGYLLYPGNATGAVGNISQNINSVLPRSFYVQVAPGDASNYQYSINASIIL